MHTRRVVAVQTMQMDPHIDPSKERSGCLCRSSCVQGVEGLWCRRCRWIRL